MFSLILHQKDGDREEDRRIPLTGERIILGRGPSIESNFVSLYGCEGRISRVHATLVLFKREWYCVDGSPDGAKSAHGILLNGQKIETPFKLAVGQKIELLNANGWHTWLEVADPSEEAALDRTIPPAAAETNQAIALLRQQVKILEQKIAENTGQDSRVQAEIATLRTLEQRVEQANAQQQRLFRTMLHEQRERTEEELRAAKYRLAAFQTRAQKDLDEQRRQLAKLWRILCGLVLAVGIVGAVVLIADPHAQDQLTQILLNCLVAIAGTGGLLFSDRLGPTVRTPPTPPPMPPGPRVQDDPYPYNDDEVTQ